MQYFSVKGWEKHQHYKDRNPPWIKLHREVLDDYDMSCLQDASKLHLILIWVLASQLNNRIPMDANWIAKKIGATTKINLNELIDKGFLLLEQNASNALAECSPETEAQEETDIPPDPQKKNLLKMPHEKIPDPWRQWAMKEKLWDDAIVSDVWASFVDYWRDGKGKKTKREDWQPTWRNWCRKENIRAKEALNGKRTEQSTPLQSAYSGKTREDVIAEIHRKNERQQKMQAGSIGAL